MKYIFHKSFFYEKMYGKVIFTNVQEELLKNICAFCDK